MNLRILEFLAVALAFITTASMGNTEETAASKEPLMKFKVRTTAYTHTESDHVEYGNKSALGTVLRYTPEYHSAAADWSFLPMGTKFKIKGYDRLFVVDDYGSALVGKTTIDIYFTTENRMNNWGVRHVEVQVIEFGSFHESRKVLASRGTYPHCLAMLRRLTQDPWYEKFLK